VDTTTTEAGRPGRKQSERYGQEIRAEAARMARNGRSATQIARALGIPPSTAQLWIARIQEAQGGRAAMRLETALAFKADVEARLAERDARNAARVPCIYVDVFGDPPPGRSALDKMRAAGRLPHG
jgi:hypothetical protein